MSAVARSHFVNYYLRNCQNASLIARNSLLTTVTQPVRCRSTKNQPETEELNRPLPFSQSKAASWSASSSFSGKEKADDSPWYQPFVISLSCSAILIWFCVLREENDIDKKLGRSLYDQVDGLERVQIELCLKYNKEHGLETAALQKRLDELIKESQESEQ